MKKIIALIFVFFVGTVVFGENFNGINGFIPGMDEQQVRTLIKEKGYNLSKNSGKTSIVLENVLITDEPLLQDKIIDIYLGFYNEKLMIVSLWMDSLAAEESKTIARSLEKKYLSSYHPHEKTVISQFTTDVYFYTSNWFLGDVNTWDGEAFNISFSDAELWYKSEAEREITWVNNRKYGR